MKYLESTVKSSGESEKEVKKYKLKRKLYQSVMRPRLSFVLETVSLEKRHDITEQKIAELLSDMNKNEYIKGDSTC